MPPTSADAVALMNGRSLNGSPFGVSCKFVKINEEWGLKLYRNKAIRNECYEWQGKAAKHGLGPQVGDMVELPSAENGFIHGYITQIVELLIEPYTGSEEQEGPTYWKKFDAIAVELSEECRELRGELMGTIGFPFPDDHPQNLGRINGKLVCIDFEVR